MNRLRSLSLTCLFLLATARSPAQSNLRLEAFGLEEGLSQSLLYCVLQDKNGFVWAGTQDGLNRYDGYRFRIYRTYGEYGVSLSDKWVYALAEGAGDVLWVGTGSGLNRLNTVTLHNQVFLHSPTTANSISSNFIRALAVDRGGKVWIGTEADGLNVLDESTNQIKRYRAGKDSSRTVCNDNINCIYTDRKGNVWIGTRGGLCRLDKNTERFTHYVHEANNANSLSGNNVLRITEDSEGRIWIGTFGDGLNRFDPDTKLFTRYLHRPAVSNSIGSNHINGIVEDDRKVLWIATNNGLTLFNKERTQFSRYTATPGDAYGLRSNDLSCLAKGREGLLWIGGRVLHKYNAAVDRFAHYKRNAQSKNTLSSNYVWPVVQDDEGILWIGTLENGGLNRYDALRNRWTNFRHDAANPNSISDNNVWYLYKGRNNKLWITTTKGLNCLDVRTNRIVRYLHDSKNKTGLSGRTNLCQVLEDKTGTVWVGTVNGLNKLDSSTGQFTHFFHNESDPQSVSGNKISCLAERKNGTLWVGTFDSGLNLFNASPATFSRFTHKTGDANSINNTSVYCVYETDDGTVWIGGDKGIDILDLATGKAAHIREKDGLPNETVMRIEQDKQGRMWCSTNRGLVCISPKTKAFAYYTTADGLQSFEFNGYSSWHNKRTDQLFFGGVNGLTAFHPDSILPNRHKPAVYISSLKVFGDANAGAVQEQNMMDKKELTLPFSSNLFSVEFLSLSLAKPSHNRYAYQLSGFHDQWIQLGTKREVTFAALPPGRYTLRVKGSNGSDVWNETPTELAIRILPPWYRTWWFYGLCAFAITAVLYLLFQFRLKQKLQVLQIRNRLHRDLHDDVGATLSSIKAYSEILGQNGKSEIIQGLIKENAAEMIDRLEVISWATNPHYDNVKSLTDAVLKFARPLTHAAGIELLFESTVDGATVLPGDVRQNLLLVVKEAVNNTIKYAAATECRITMRTADRKLTMEIADNGRGHDGTVKGSGSGWKNMQRRAEEMNGTLSIESTAGGTRIWLSVPYPFKMRKAGRGAN